MQIIQWDANGLPLNTDLSTILYHIRADENGRGLLLDAVTNDEFNADYSADFIQEDYLDSLSVFYNKLNMTARLIANTMNKVGGDLQCVIAKGDDENGIEANPNITKPYKKYGVLNVSLVLTLSDAQTVTVVLHNPDSTPSKIAPHDMMVAWKWLLNKKDITAVVSPESGKDLAVQEIAKRIMQLANKNSAAFTKANQNSADTMKQLDDLSNDINSLGMVLKSKNAELAVVKSDYEDWQVIQATAPASTVSGDYTHTFNDGGVTIRVRRDEDGTGWDGEDGSSYDGSIDDEVEAIGGDVPVTPQPTVIGLIDKKDAWQYVDHQGLSAIDAVVLLKGAYNFGGYGSKQDKVMSDYDISENYYNAAVSGLLSKGLIKKTGKSFSTTNSGVKILETYADELSRLTGIKIDEINGGKYYDGFYSVNGNYKHFFIKHINNELAQPIPAPAQPTQTIDPVTLANINASGISAAIKKKAIAYLSANPASHDITGISKKSMESILDSVNTALYQEVLSILPVIEKGMGFGISMSRNGSKGNPHWMVSMRSINQNKVTQFGIDAGYNFFATIADNVGISVNNVKNLFDSTSTIEDLKSWDFALPFDLDVKAFVANVIKPVVDEFLSKQVALNSYAVRREQEKENKATPTQTIDPVTLANINASGISAAIKKKAIAYLQANPTSHQMFEKETAAGKKAYAAVINNLRLALSSEILALSPLFTMDDSHDDMWIVLSIDDNNRLVFKATMDNGDYILSFNRYDDSLQTILFDSTQTLEDLKSWDFALPFDLDVKAFVANVIKPVVDEFLSKQVAGKRNMEQPELPAVETPTNSFDADIEALRGLVGSDEFKPSVNSLLDALEEAGNESYDDVIGEIINQHAAAKVAAAKGA